MLISANTKGKITIKRYQKKNYSVHVDSGAEKTCLALQFFRRQCQLEDES